ncbi:uncharacterized protein [Halyomorpha halys]|uniref:uncharacterized protein n=1 Tax=Halyomorpha halys TaxID=286706 RepID=UPI0034D172E6
MMNQVNDDYRFRYKIAKSLELISNDCLSIQEREKRLPLVELSENRPLLVLLTWVASKRTQAFKYVDVYLEKGFDVLIVSTTTWQMYFPGTGIVATSSALADFLNDNQSYQPLVIHALSVGCYVWSFTEEQIMKNQDKYESTIERLKGYMCDSPPVGTVANMLSHLYFKKDNIFRVIAEPLLYVPILLSYFFFLQIYGTRT